MPSVSYGVTVSGVGVTIQGSAVRTDDGLIAVEATIPAAKALTSWVKTDANTAAGVLAGGHGLTSGTFDVYWTGGRKYGATGTVSTNALSLDLGTGDDYPASADTTVVCQKQTVVNVSIDGDAASIVALQLVVSDTAATTKGHATFKDSAADVITEQDFTANVPVVYDIDGGATNVFTGDPIVTAHVTNGNSSYAATLKIIGCQDVTP